MYTAHGITLSGRATLWKLGSSVVIICPPGLDSNRSRSDIINYPIYEDGDIGVGALTNDDLVDALQVDAYLGDIGNIVNAFNNTQRNFQPPAPEDTISF